MGFDGIKIILSFLAISLGEELASLAPDAQYSPGRLHVRAELSAEVVVGAQLGAQRERGALATPSAEPWLPHPEDLMGEGGAGRTGEEVGGERRKWLHPACKSQPDSRSCSDDGALHPKGAQVAPLPPGLRVKRATHAHCGARGAFCSPPLFPPTMGTPLVQSQREILN